MYMSINKWICIVLLFAVFGCGPPVPPVPPGYISVEEHNVKLREVRKEEQQKTRVAEERVTQVEHDLKQVEHDLKQVEHDLRETKEQNVILTDTIKNLRSEKTALRSEKTALESEKRKLIVDLAIAYYNLGRSKYDEEDYDRAEKWLDKAIEINKDFTDALYYRAAVYYKQRNYSKANNEARKVLRLKRSYQDSLGLFEALDLR